LNTKNSSVNLDIFTLFAVKTIFSGFNLTCATLEIASTPNTLGIVSDMSKVNKEFLLELEVLLPIGIEIIFLDHSKYSRFIMGEHYSEIPYMDGGRSMSDLLRLNSIRFIMEDD